MKQSTIIRVLGSVLIVLGIGSAWMRTKMDMDTILTAWMGNAQPWSGIAMALVGVALWAVATVIRRRATVAA